MATHGLSARYATNGGVRIHYLAAGAGDAVVLLHGFPDFSGGWRHQIAGLSRQHCVAAPDLRGVNRSDAPGDPAAYRMAALVNDVLSVISALGRRRATLIGHDWGAI